MSDTPANPTVRHVARITIQLRTPLHLGSGQPGDFSDADLVYDANDLPAIPGSSIAGVLRALYGKDTAEADDLFGFQKGNAQGQGSRLTVSWACLHNRESRVIEGLADPTAIGSDAVLRLASQPSMRDHVRITHTGVADAKGHGKFDELSLQIGHRFTFEMELRGEAGQREADAAVLQALIAKLQEPEFRLGGKTRRGFGAVEVVSVKTGTFDLAEAAERKRYLEHPVSLADKSTVLVDVSLAKSKPSAFAELVLKPRGFWMFGGGVDVDVANGTANWKASDMAPVRDTVIEWKNDQAELLKNCLIIPGSSIKGAIAHRTAYHFNCLEGRFIDPDADDAKERLEEYSQSNQAIEDLFGSAKNDGSGERGHVLIDDLYLPPNTPTRRVPHVSIDRFTGGALDGALFDERPVVGGLLPLKVYLDKPAETFPGHAIEALRRALSDLAEGCLALGAGVGRGNGFFEGTLEILVSPPEKATA
jgi:CRISPR/Cas system CMR subunit Cmr4 (Cas7 group RAMP superfamily)